MAGKWDSTLKQLIKINPQHFVSRLLEGAQYVGELSPHLNRSLDMDTLHEVVANGKHFAVHIEFQRRSDADMAKRIWEYNVLASRILDYTVVSFVIYLKEDGMISLIALYSKASDRWFGDPSFLLYQHKTVGNTRRTI